MVQNAEDRSEVLDGDVVLLLTKTGERDIRTAATRVQATNKLLYAARVVFSSAGMWHVHLEINARGTAASAAGDIAVVAEKASWIAYWPYFAMLPVAVGLFALNQWLKARRRVTNPRVRP